jgi:hypothetical protein
MEHKDARRPTLAHAIATSNVALTLVALTLLLLTLDHPPVGGWGFRGFPVIFAVTAGTVGWLIMLRRPDNRIGLIMALSGLMAALQLFLTEYSTAAAREGLPLAELTAWVNAFVWVPGVGLMSGAIPLLFPDGRLPSGAWRPVAWLITLGAAAVMVIIALYPSAIDTPRPAVAPFRVPISDADLNRASYVALLVFGAGCLLAAVSLLRRWRGSSGVVREQIKWLAMAAVVVVAIMPLSLIPTQITNAAFIVAVGLIPVSVGVAVLRYRLYEIDTVISRTVVFGLLTAVLAGSFAALQRLFQAIFVSATGNESDAALVITTLILATSFTPLKGLIEKVVERRFKEAPATSRSRDATALAADDPESTEEMLRRVLREELSAALKGEEPDRRG